MFYLNHYFKVLFKSPIRGFFLVLFSFLMVFSLGQKTLLENQFMKLIPENKSGAYFYALINTSESYQTIMSQMSVLPGVYKVEMLSEEQIKKEVSGILNSVQVNLDQSLIDFNYIGIKVIYAKDLKLRAQELVRDYLTHLVPEGKLTMGAIKTEDLTVEKRNQMISFIKTWGYSFIVFLLTVFWVISLILVRNKIAETSYLLESYQRKSKVSFKMAINGMSIIFILACGLTFILGIPQIMNLSIALAIFIVGMLAHSKKHQWDA